MSPRHLDAHTLHPSYDGPCVDARPQLEPLVRPVGDNKLVDVRLLNDHYVIIHYNIRTQQTHQALQVAALGCRVII